jgi:hypothetical protein
MSSQIAYSDIMVPKMYVPKFFPNNYALLFLLKDVRLLKRKFFLKTMSKIYRYKEETTFKKRGYLHIFCVAVTKCPARGTSVFFHPPSSMQFWSENKQNHIDKWMDR